MDIEILCVTDIPNFYHSLQVLTVKVLFKTDVKTRHQPIQVDYQTVDCEKQFPEVLLHLNHSRARKAWDCTRTNGKNFNVQFEQNCGEKTES